MPNLLTLMQSGAYSVNARTTFPSATLPSHASMLTGLCPQKHAVTWNDYLPEYGYAQGTDLFDLAHAAGLKTAMVVGKKKLIQITEPPSLDYFLFVNDRDLILAQRLSVEAPIDFNLLFVHFALTDMMGHEYGWNSPNQLSVIRRADEALGLTLAWLEANALRQETLLLITSDHGGHEFTHGSSDPQDMTIPWVLSGAGVRPGLLNTPIQTTDTAATLAWALRLPLPPEWDGIPILEAFGQPQPLRLQPFCEDR
jgi:predicted AlkP superfamily pyrophosphatase or phosphodiesterase